MNETVPRTTMSSHCRNDEHKTCSSLGMRCACECHGKAGQKPPATRPATPLRPVPGPPPAVPGKLPEGFKWEEPRGRGNGRSQVIIHQAVLDLLKANPGRWARVREYAKGSSAASAAQRINGTGKAKQRILGPGWHARANKVGDTSALYLRWVGGSDGAA
jgi:hypothetical protein